MRSQNDSGQTELPRLLNEHPEPTQDAMKRLFKFIGQWRKYLFRQWLYSEGSREEHNRIFAAVDDLISLTLLFHFIRQRDSSALPELKDIIYGLKRPSVWCIAQRAREATFSPVLKSLFDLKMMHNRCLIPKAVIASSWHSSIAEAAEQTCGALIPVSVFGDFHQFCLAYPLRRRAETCEIAKKGKTPRYEKGIHYTPSPIVDYLVYQTLENAFEGLSNNEIVRMRILDPSCGCGSFLIAAFRYIVKQLWNTDVVRKNPPEVLTERFQRTSCGISPQTCLDVLRSMIFGIDIDEKATQWTVCALLLTAWEVLLPSSHDANHALLAVPDLADNIVCADFLDSSVPFNCPQLAEGVNVIIGGPPFVHLQQLRKTEVGKVEGYKQRFTSARKGQFDLYMLFLEKSIRTLADGGVLGVSSSNTFLRSESGRGLRGFVADRCSMEEIVEFEDSKVYPDAVTQIALLTLHKGVRRTPAKHLWIKGRGNLREKLSLVLSSGGQPNSLVEVRHLPSETFRSDSWSLASNEEEAALLQIESVGGHLGDLPIEICQGVYTGADDILLLRAVSRTQSTTVVRQRYSQREIMLESEALRPIVRGRDTRGYHILGAKTLCVFPYDTNGNILDENEFLKRFPLAYDYMKSDFTRLEKRRFKNGEPWCALGRANAIKKQLSPKLVAGMIDSGCGFTFDAKGQLFCHSSIITIYPSGNIDPYYLLGVLNSSIFWEFIRHRTPTMGNGRHVYRINAVRKFPFVVPTAGRVHRLAQEVSKLAEQLLNSGTENSGANDIQRAIDKIICEIYRLKWC